MWPRYIFLLFAGVSLLLGLITALSRLGVTTNDLSTTLSGIHGPLMVFGFIGGAIGLERAVSVVNSSPTHTLWPWAGPGFHALGVITLIGAASQPTFAPPFITEHPQAIAGIMFTLSQGVLGALYYSIYRRQPSLAVLIQACGVIGGASATALFASGAAFADILPLTAVFVVATIIGERCELARVSIAGANAETHLTALICAVTAASIIYIAAPQLGYPLIGALLIVTAVATARVDIARHMLKSTGLPRFSAVAMMLAYAWLSITGLVWLAFGQSSAGFAYDAAVHTLFIGFTMSMILAHAPIILTGVIRRPLPYHPVMYVALVLLHTGLAARVISAARQATGPWQVAGVVTVLAVVVFLLVSVTLTVRGGSMHATISHQHTPRVEV
ncbi:hypothetical protein GC425_06320 [Corynebacterium sp. zg254]|uniref:Uncharacterized protein n=1 Tax=Corynebacterium zhongnanshanii TaxID=2768834 RepID=A0ABQ6VDT7_9CORY|nr:hypothetical protein F8377_06340 [Corynebacterium zhongnanshanii]MCR5914482.1 hypothetical protein [Corynebacterium sp. zg254]